MKAIQRFLLALLLSLVVFWLYVWLLEICITLLGYSAQDTGRTRGWLLICTYLAGITSFVPIFLATFSLQYPRNTRFTLGAQATLVSFFFCVLGMVALTWFLKKTGLHILSITLLIMRGGTHIFAIIAACTMIVSVLILKPPRQLAPRPRHMLFFTLVSLCLIGLFFLDYLGTRGYSLPPWYPWRGVPRFAVMLCLVFAGISCLAARGSALCRPLMGSFLLLVICVWGRDWIRLGYTSLPPLFGLKLALLILATALLNSRASRLWQIPQGNR